MPSEAIEIGGATLRAREGRLEGPSGTAHLEPRLVELAVELARRAGRVVSRDRLIDAVWKGYPGAEASLNNTVSKLRAALKHAGAGSDSIETVPKRGYRMHADAVRRPESGPSLPLLAVLPFRVIGLPDDDQYLGEAVAEDVQQALSRVAGIRITARTSTFSLAASNEPLSAYGRQLGASMALEGSIRRGAGIVVRVALSTTGDAEQRWSGEFTLAESELESLPRRLVEDVRAALPRAGDARSGPLRTDRVATVPAGAYKAFLKGRYFWYRENTNPGRALALYREAIRAAPDFAPPYAGLVDCYCTYGAWQIMPQDEAREQALASASQALALDPDGIDSIFSLGYVHFYARWDWQAAEDAFRRVLAERPDHILAHSFLALLLTTLGRDEEAAEIADRLVELDPASGWCWWMRGLCAFYRRDYACMAESGEEGLEVSPAEPSILWIASAGLAQTGQVERARALVADLERIAGDSDMFRGIAATIRIFCGERDEALAHCAELERRARARPVSPLVMSFVYAALGRIEDALDAVEAAHAERNMVLWFVSRELTIDPLRAEPRFIRILGDMGLPLRRESADAASLSVPRR